VVGVEKIKGRWCFEATKVPIHAWKKVVAAYPPVIRLTLAAAECLKTGHTLIHEYLIYL